MPDQVISNRVYKSFEGLYGTDTNDGDRPSSSATNRDKQFKSILVSCTSFSLWITRFV